MSQLIPFEQSRLPAHIAARFQARGPSALSQNVGTSFGIISIKGKVFHIVRGDDRQLITRPGEDEPASSIDVVIVDANPALSKTYYPSGYEEGSVEKPTCYSQDGITPGADAAEPQASRCAICPHNQFGSRITDNGSKGKACSDFRRLAVAQAGAVEDAMMLRVPAASLKPLAQYGDMLAKRGVDFGAVVTKIGFDYTVAHPSLTFKPVGFIDEETAQHVEEARHSAHVKAVLGIVETGAAVAQTPAAAAPKPAAEAPAEAPVAAPAPAPKPRAAAPKPKTASFASSDDPRPSPPAPAPVAAAPKAAPAPAPMVVDSQAAADIGDMLAGINFDD